MHATHAHLRQTLRPDTHNCRVSAYSPLRILRYFQSSTNISHIMVSGVCMCVRGASIGQGLRPCSQSHWLFPRPQAFPHFMCLVCHCSHRMLCSALDPVLFPPCLSFSFSISSDHSLPSHRPHLIHKLSACSPPLCEVQAWLVHLIPIVMSLV